MWDNEVIFPENVEEYLEEFGHSGIDQFFRRKLEEWKDVDITIGITGDAGAGKSSLINAITGGPVAKTGVTETTKEPAEYTLPENKNITLRDLPGIGSTSFPDLQTYYEKVHLEEYDAFLIITAGRFDENNIKLAQKMESIRKPFFLIRTKIDQDIENERYDNAKSEESTLSEIREDYRKILTKLTDHKQKRNAFLISNHHKNKWDFSCLIPAILDALPPCQQESLILSLRSDSKDVIKRKVKVLRGRISMVAAASTTVAAVPAPGLCIAFDVSLLMNEMNFYKSQLGIPEENSKEFERMTRDVKAKVLKYHVTSAVKVEHLVEAYAARFTTEEFEPPVPVPRRFIAESISFSSTHWFLHECLKELEEAAFALYKFDLN